MDPFIWKELDEDGPILPTHSESQSPVAVLREFNRKRRFAAKWGTQSVPSHSACKLLARESGDTPMLQPFAGKGLWAALIQSFGAEVIAVDNERRLGFTTVRKKEAGRCIKEFKGRTLFLEWPCKLFTLDFFKEFKGDRVLFVGTMKKVEPALAAELDKWKLYGYYSLRRWVGNEDSIYQFQR